MEWVSEISTPRSINRSNNLKDICQTKQPAKNTLKIGNSMN